MTVPPPSFGGSLSSTSFTAPRPAAAPPTAAPAAPPPVAPPFEPYEPPVPPPAAPPLHGERLGDTATYARAVGAAPPAGPVRDGSDAWLRRMRALRAEAQDLRVALDEVRRGGAPLSRYVEYLGKTCADIDELVLGIGDDDDCVRHVRNAWEQMRTCEVIRAPDRPLDPQLQTQLLNHLDAQARRIVYWTCYRTIPDRLKTWLREAQPGYAIPFHAVFEDELPEAEDRQKILNYLACTPEALKDVGGLVDPDSGLVYRYHPSPRRRLLSVATLAGVLVALTALVAFVGPQIAPPGQTGWTSRGLLFGWIAVLIGTVTHVGVALAKRMRSHNANPAVLPVGKVMVLMNAKEGLILLRTGLALLGFFVLAFASGVPEADEFGTYLLNAFLVGYSLDSVVELFGAGMEQRAGALQSGLKARLGTSG